MGAHGVPRDDAGPDNLQVAVPGLDPLAEIPEPHPGDRGLDGLADSPLEVRHPPEHWLDGLADRPLNQDAEVLRVAGVARVPRALVRGLLGLGLLGLRLVPRLDLDVRLLGDLASREPLLETPEDFGPLHRSTTLTGARTSTSR